jgi:alkanesulfonate monooxygenase SsuD/methylene tetrahydromethanopterin reductase-like flavin-dependent oxidoreductase (luciferase family)
MSEVTFGLGIPPSVLPGTDPVAIARMAEDLGFDFVSASDHPCGTEPTYETWTMLSWIAAATSRIRVATRVLGVPTGTRRWSPRWPRRSPACRAAD